MSIGIWQIVLILVIILIIFGAGKLPRVMGDVAKGIKSFKSGMKEGEQAQASATENASSESPKVIDKETKPHVEASAVEKDEAAKS